MNEGTYRTPTLTPPAGPPLWQRIAAKVAPELFGARDWQWYRREVGGRWCPITYTDEKRSEEGATWARVHVCPARVALPAVPSWRGLVLAEQLPVPIEWDAWPAHDHAKGCACEVYE
jgi:hypothetical protein